LPQIAELWQSVTPTWTGGSIGNGILWCRVRRLNKSYQFNFYLEIGSTTSFTTWSWNFTAVAGMLIAFPPNANQLQQVQMPCVAVVGGKVYGGIGEFNLHTGGGGSNRVSMIPYIDTSVAGGGIHQVNSALPGTWATGDFLVVSNAIEAFDN